MAEKKDKVNFEQIKKTYKILKNFLGEDMSKIYLAGGIVPYLLLNEDSKRLHNDIDIICDKNNIFDLRERIKNSPYYKFEKDSKNFVNDNNDYGFEFEINGVPIGIFPFTYNNQELLQYSYDSSSTECKIKSFYLEDINDYIYSYRSKNDEIYKTMSLEYIKKSKDIVARPKDLIDSKKIEEFGYKKDIYAKIEIPNEIQKLKYQEINSKQN